MESSLFGPDSMTSHETSPLVHTCVLDASTRSYAQKTLPPNTADHPYFWFPMYVRYRQELSVQKALESNDFRTFIPMEYYDIKRGHKVITVSRPAIHNLIFVYSFRERITWMKMYNRYCLPLQYMSRPLFEGGSEIITVSEKAMDNIIRAATLDDPNGQRSYIERDININDLDKNVKFVDGSFKGVEGVIKRIDKNRVMIIPLVNKMNIKITIARASDIEYT